MLSLGLDPSLKAFGWCVYDSSKKLIDSSHEMTSAGDIEVTRYMYFRSMVERIINIYPEISIIGIESPAYEAGPFMTTHHCIMMYCMEAAFLKKIDVILFDPSTNKSFVSDKGSRTPKEDMQRYVQMDMKSHIKINNNEADAYIIAKFACRFKQLMNGEISAEDLSDKERHIFINRTKNKKLFGDVKQKKSNAHILNENSRYFSFSRVEVDSVKKPRKQKISKEIIKLIRGVLLSVKTPYNVIENREDSPETCAIRKNLK